MAASSRSVHNPIRREYARLAPIYDAKWFRYVQATTRQTLARFTVSAGDRVLDVGCGTGALLQQLSQASPQAIFVGIDPVAEMLGVARRRLPAAVELREGSAENLPFDKATFDVVVSCSAFHYFREPVAALREMTRVLRRGGRLVITDWCRDYLACRVCDWFLRLVNSAHLTAYRERECLGLLRSAGYQDAVIERYKMNWLWGLMTAKATKEAG